MAPAQSRQALVRRGQLLSRATLAYNTFEGLASVIIGAMAGSIALVGFGIDSVIEVISSVAALWRLHDDADIARRAQTERRTLRVIGVSFLALALYLLIEGVSALVRREIPSQTRAGIVVAAASVVIMPLLARAKRRVGIALGSRALTADARQTSLCMWLSAIVLVGLVLNATLGWWWADPVAALCMTPLIVKDGLEGLRGETCCDDDA